LDKPGAIESKGISMKFPRLPREPFKGQVYRRFKETYHPIGYILKVVACP